MTTGENGRMYTFYDGVKNFGRADELLGESLRINEKAYGRYSIPAGDVDMIIAQLREKQQRYGDALNVWQLGLFIGRWLATVIDGRLGHNLGKTVFFGLLIGMSLSPLNLVFMGVLGIFGNAFAGHGTFPSALEALGYAMFSPVCFIAGVMRPTVWGDRW